MAAGTLLEIDAYVTDWGGNTLYVANRVPFYLSIAASPAAPDGAVLYDRTPAFCAVTTCTGMTDGVNTELGIARFRNIWLNKPGSYKLTVQAPSGNTVPLETTTNTLVVTLGNAARLRVIDSTTSAVPGEAMFANLEVTDAAQNRVTTALASNVTVTSSNALGGTTSLPVTNGLVSFTDLTLSTAGTHTLQYSSGTLAATSSQVVVTGTPAVLITASPSGSGSDLSSTEIAVIIVAVIVALILLALLVCFHHITSLPSPLTQVYWLFRRSQRSKKTAENPENSGLGKEPTEGTTQPNWQEMPARDTAAKGTLQGSRYGDYPNDNPLDQAPYLQVNKSPIRTPFDQDASFVPDFTDDQFGSNQNRSVKTPADPVLNEYNIDVGDNTGSHPAPPTEGQPGLQDLQQQRSFLSQQPSHAIPQNSYQPQPSYQPSYSQQY